MGAGLGTASQGPAKEDHLPAPGRLLPAGPGSKGPGWVPGRGSGSAVAAHVMCVPTWLARVGSVQTLVLPARQPPGSPDGFGGSASVLRSGGMGIRGAAHWSERVSLEASLRRGTGFPRVLT